MTKINSNKSSRRSSVKTDVSKIARKGILDNKIESSSAEFSQKERSSHLLLNKRNKTLLAIFTVVCFLAILGYFFKDNFIAATINGKPVFRYELNKRLTSVFGKETLENLIVEKLIQKEAKSKGVTVSDKDISDEVTKLEKSLSAGMKLEDALKYQGVSLTEFKNQLKLRLQINRILEKEVTISPEEIDKYLKDNAKTIIATGESERKQEAKDKLKEQKIAERIQQWVSELLAKAKISRFLK